MDFNLNAVFQTFVPKDKKFFPLFEKASANVVQCSRLLHEALKADSVTRMQSYARIEELEKQGDEITHVIMAESASSFLTPIDREDVQALAVILDDVIDYMHGVSKRIELYKILHMHPAFIRMAERIQYSCIELDSIIRNLHSLRMTDAVKTSLARIREAEKQIDEIHDDAVGSLFLQENNAVEILKLKEVFSFLEGTGDKIEETGSVIEAILLKFS